MTRNEKILYAVVDLLLKSMTLVKKSEFYEFSETNLKKNLTRIETTCNEFLEILRRGKQIYVVEDLKESQLHHMKQEGNAVYFGNDLGKIAVNKMEKNTKELDLKNESVSVDELNIPSYFQEFIINFAHSSNYLEQARDNMKSLSEKELHKFDLVIKNAKKFADFVNEEIF